jgi:shikimate O-hydroxycinnamoyltransferase
MKPMILTPVDQLFTGNTACPVTFAFAYSELLDAKRLEAGLHSLVEVNPWLGGRMRAEGDYGYAFDVSGPSCLSLEVVSSTQSFIELSRTEALVRCVDARDGEALVSARLTQTPYGSIVGVSMSHALVDGFSLFHTLASWASCTRGGSAVPPAYDRPLHVPETLTASLDPTPASLLRDCGLFLSQPRPETRRLPVPERIGLRAQEITRLVALAQRGVDVKLRQNDVLTAWLWKTYGPLQWSAAPGESVYVTCPVDVRRLLGAANQDLFACAINFATASASLDELIHAPLGELALRIQRSVAAVVAQPPVQRLAPLDALRRRHGRRALESVHLHHPQRGMLVTNMSRLPLERLDFGCGAPVDLKVYTEIDSMAAILPALDGVAIDVGRSNVRSMRTATSPERSAAALRKTGT